jgi:cytochrome o ubiquinol oxidase operon protein cyoD
MDAVGLTIREGIARYVIGFVIACALTTASFYVLNTSLIWGPGIPVALVVLAVAQISVHLVFFLHITDAARWRLAIDDVMRLLRRLELR